MAAVTKATRVGMDASTGMYARHPAAGLLAGADIAAGAPCYINADGKVYEAIGTTLNAAATKVRGFAPKAFKAGEAVALYGANARFRWGSGLTPGQDLYLGLTSGGLDTAATTGGTVPIAFAIDATDIMVL